MTRKESNELRKSVDAYRPAFPVVLELGGDSQEVVANLGMSRRDYFAAAALTGVLASRTGGVDPEVDAGLAYRYADAMLAAGKVGP